METSLKILLARRQTTLARYMSEHGLVDASALKEHCKQENLALDVELQQVTALAAPTVSNTDEQPAPTLAPAKERKPRKERDAGQTG